MNALLNGLKENCNYTLTENGGVTHKSTLNSLLDFFAMGAAYRTRSDEDCILLFKNAYEESPEYALKCLFYIRDILEGQGERRFFRVVTKWLASYDTDAIRRNLIHIPNYGRWDDLLVFLDTPVENDALSIIRHQLALDVQDQHPSLLAKWLPSENTSSAETRTAARKVRKFLNMTSKQYRKVLSILRARINILERLMSENRWDEIEFDKIPSKAGLKYKKAFMRHDIERPQNQSYASFMADNNTKVNAGALYPYEVVNDALRASRCDIDDTARQAANKYWDSLQENYFDISALDALGVVDTSNSMTWYGGAACPMNVAISLGIYCAERAKGPFAGHYISFSSKPQLVKVEGVDFCDKVRRIYNTNLCDNTNIEAVFDLLLNTAIKNNCTQADLPQNILILSDMEFDAGTNHGYEHDHQSWNPQTLMESIRIKWARHGYRLPHLIYWNIQARQNNVPEKLGCGLISYISGMSPSIFETILSGKSGYELMMEVLNKDRYSVIK